MSWKELDETPIRFGVWMNLKTGALAYAYKSDDDRYDWEIDKGKIKNHMFLRMKMAIVAQGTGNFFFNKHLRGYELIDDEKEELKPLSEVLEYVKKESTMGVFAFHADPLVTFLSYEEAVKSGLFNEKLTPEDWTHPIKPYTREEVLSEMKSYLSFGFEKAFDRRGLSANRTIQKMQTWLTMLGDDAMAKEIEEFSDYGLQHLRNIDAKYFDSKVEQGEVSDEI